MQALPQDFLQEIATYCKLSHEQSEAFIAFYSSDASREEVAEELEISAIALNGRLIRAYEKIGNHEDKNKIKELRSLLWEKYQLNNGISIKRLFVKRK